MKLPPGVQEVRAANVEAFAAPDVEAWVRAALERGERLHDAATREACALLHGRGPVPVVSTSRGRWVVRRYHRGGQVARLLSDRYVRFGYARPVREAQASSELRRRGIPTPPVVAGAVYPAGPFYRADLVTEFVPGAVDLARLLFEEEHTPVERIEVLIGVGRLLARTAAAGIEHLDLNAKNVLLETLPAGAIPLLLDLDHCLVLPPGERADPMRMVARLARSLRKHEDGTRRPLADEERLALSDAAQLRSGD